MDSDLPLFSVQQLIERANAALDDSIGMVCVEAEVFEYRGPHRASGHYYFKLRDAEATLDVKMWRGVAARGMRCQLEEGQRVLVRGRLDIWATRGSLALVLESVEDRGSGALAQRFEILKQQLTGQGLFDAARKRPLPPRPRRVVLITAVPSAAAADVLQTLQEGGLPAEIMLLPCRVQGGGAAQELARALRFAPRLDPDLILLARGGGSLEDLWAFNEEILVREVAACPVPVITAVGHETDFSLCDFAADHSARTPTAAAVELCAGWQQARRSLQHNADRLQHAAQALLSACRQRVDRAGRNLHGQRPERRLERARRALHENEVRLDNAVRHALRRRRHRLARLGLGLTGASPQGSIRGHRHHLKGLQARIQAASPLAPLSRGYALIEAEGQPGYLRSVAGVRPGSGLRLQLADGRLAAEVTAVETRTPDRDSTSA